MIARSIHLSCLLHAKKYLDYMACVQTESENMSHCFFLGKWCLVRSSILTVPSINRTSIKGSLSVAKAAPELIWLGLCG